MKSLIEKINNYNIYFETKRKESAIILLQVDKIKSFENEMKKDKNNELKNFIDKLKLKRERSIESKIIHSEDKFIEI